jgi:hypothetical protein
MSNLVSNLTGPFQPFPSAAAEQAQSDRSEYANARQSPGAPGPTGGGPLFVVDGATCVCTFGTSANHLKGGACVDAATTGGDPTSTNITDRTFYATFGFCLAPGKPPFTVPCKPVTPSPWAPGATQAWVGGAPGLVQTDVLLCSKGGLISITNAGQSSARYGVVAPVGPEAEANTQSPAQEAAEAANQVQNAEWLNGGPLPPQSPLVQNLTAALQALQDGADGYRDAKEQAEERAIEAEISYEVSSASGQDGQVDDDGG